MGRELKLSGGEIRVLKTIGLSGSPINGAILFDKVEEFEKAEFLETLTEVIESDYVICNKVNIRTKEDVVRAFFRVNPTWAKELRDAINPSRNRDKDRERRRRRG